MLTPTFRTGRHLLALLFGFAVAAAAQGSPDLIWSFEGHAQSVRGVAFSPDGQFVVSGAGYADSRAIAWAATDGARLHSYDHTPHDVQSVDVSPAGSHLAVGYIVTGYPPGGETAVWDLETGEIVHTFGGCHAAFSPGGVYVASGGGGALRYVYLSRISDGIQLQSWYHGSYVLDVAYAPDGNTVASAGTDNTVKLWDPKTGDLLHTLSGHMDDVNTIAFSPDATLLASGAGGWDEPGESTIKLWRVSDGELLDTWPGHSDRVECLAFTPDGGHVISSGGGTIQAWRVLDGELMLTYDEQATDIAFSPSGDRFFYGTPFRIVAMANWELASADVATGEPAASPLMLQGPRPNPLTSQSTLTFALPSASPVALTVHDAAGRRVRTLLQGDLSAGAHHPAWDGRDRRGIRVAPGVYFVRLQTNQGSETTRLAVLQ